MSIWRDIWKETIKVNSLVAKSGNFSEYDHLYTKYGDDGMIHYAAAQSYEFIKKHNEAITEYKKALDCFPVPHWKIIAEKNIQRLVKRQTPEQFFDLSDFNDLLWYGFQKMYQFVNLKPFNRYVALSALSRGSSEWPLTLVDFRTVMELEIKHHYPEIIEYRRNNGKEYSLFSIIKELENQNYISSKIAANLHAIRKAGNIAAHDAKTSGSEKVANLSNFIHVMVYFNDLQQKDYIL